MKKTDIEELTSESDEIVAINHRIIKMFTPLAEDPDNSAEDRRLYKVIVENAETSISAE